MISRVNVVFWRIWYTIGATDRVAVLHVGDVGEERKEIEVGGGEIGTPNYSSDRFRVDRMGGKDEAGDGGTR